MNKSAGVFLLIFGLFWTAIVGLFDGFIGRNLARQFRATSFLQTTATVTRSEVKAHHGDESTTYGVEIEYSYLVNGANYHGDTYRYGKFTSSDSKWAHVAVGKNPVGASVPVFYDPKNPSESVLRPGVDGSDLFLMLFLTPFNLVMLALWSGAFVVIRNKFRSAVAGGAKWADDGRILRVRLPRFSPLIAGFLVIGGGAFISMFAVGIPAGFHPSLNVMICVWGVVLSAGVGVGIWQRRKQLRGSADLVVDRGERTVSLPATFGRKERRKESFASFTGISVQSVAHQGNKGGTSYTYAVTLQTPRGGEKLTDWYDKAQAESLAAWLRERLLLGEPEAPPRKR